MSCILHVHLSHDAEAGVWVAESDDVPGLTSEAETLDGLVTRVSDVTPALLALNRPGLGQVTLEFHTTRQLEQA